ncbi:alpha/beta-hydrolase [Stereum hirsutum FP-91666 SS1]|uniref:alpha/beta-hydrolase n=1 Tax=Stereum hirsutum (strain FP-91666) TaxID=721885 RepID=UPI000440F422|nr:alpha/beta-hydrolase [Stereum hirsutum FP-91666 SS1]EIM91214.1 alpha/beta-hydrolase [Stereum hirsutum FP-91666 SS1]
MEDIKKLIHNNGCAFELGLDATFRSMYEPLYKEASPEVVKQVKDVRYGPADRNFLDVYVPLSGSPGKAVIIFVHGGGFFSGDKAWSDKVYANIGNYFAEKGIIVVVGNHQLVPDATYPAGADDIQQTREWVFSNIASGTYGQGDPNQVILFGHSSGGAHIACNVFAAGDPTRPKVDPLFPPIAGLALFSVPWWFDIKKPLRRKIIGQYYGTDVEEEWEPFSPLGLFKRLPAGSSLVDPNVLPILLGSVKYEVKETADGLVLFFNEYRARSSPTGALPLIHVLDNHNHLSNILSIGSEDEAQARAILEFVRTCAAKVVARASGSGDSVKY